MGKASKWEKRGMCFREKGSPLLATFIMAQFYPGPAGVQKLPPLHPVGQLGPRQWQRHKWISVCLQELWSMLNQSGERNALPGGDDFCQTHSTSFRGGASHISGMPPFLYQKIFTYWLSCSLGPEGPTQIRISYFANVNPIGPRQSNRPRTNNLTETVLLKSTSRPSSPGPDPLLTCSLHWSIYYGGGLPLLEWCFLAPGPLVSEFPGPWAFGWSGVCDGRPGFIIGQIHHEICHCKVW